MHDYLRSLFAGKEVVTIKGKEIHVPRSTTEMTTVEFENYMTECRVWASEQGYYIPLPNEPIT